MKYYTLTVNVTTLKQQCEADEMTMDDLDFSRVHIQTAVRGPSEKST